MSKKLFLLALALPLLSGCFLRTMRMENKMQPWVGHSIHEAVSAWGPPSGTFQNGDRTIYIWSSVGPTIVNTSVNSYGSGRYASAYTTAIPTSCRTWFDVDEEERIVGWNWQGQC